MNALAFAQGIGHYIPSSLRVIEALKSDDESLASFGLLISDAKLYIDPSDSINFSYTHNLDKHAKHVSNLLFRMTMADLVLC